MPVEAAWRCHEQSGHPLPPIESKPALKRPAGATQRKVASHPRAHHAGFSLALGGYDGEHVPGRIFRQIQRAVFFLNDRHPVLAPVVQHRLFHRLRPELVAIPQMAGIGRVRVPIETQANIVSTTWGHGKASEGLPKWFCRERERGIVEWLATRPAVIHD